MTLHELKIEAKLWKAATELRANSNLSLNEFSVPVLGMLFLKFAERGFLRAKDEAGSGREDAIKARGAIYLSPESRFSSLLEKGEVEVGAALDTAMRDIEKRNAALKGALPNGVYEPLGGAVLKSLLKTFDELIPEGADEDEDGGKGYVEGDVFGRVYEYFLENFAMGEGKHGGEFFTPPSLVKLIVEIIRPYHGLILDPASGSGGMFVQSAAFVKNHQGNPSTELSIYGQEKSPSSVKLGTLNLAIHGLQGDILEGNTFFEDRHDSVGRFDFVMANPPFNVDGVDKGKLEGDKRYPLGVPTNDNANYLWIQIFAAALKDADPEKKEQGGRAGFVMPTSAADAGPETDLRQKLIEQGLVDVMVSIGPKFFYTVPLACHLWFLDKRKDKKEKRKDKLLFIDARHIFTKVSRKIHDFTPAQMEFLANIANLYRGEELESGGGSEEMLGAHFPDGKYQDVLGLCKVASLDEVAAQGWSLNPGRYVGLAEEEDDEIVFEERLAELGAEFEALTEEAVGLKRQILANVDRILEGEE